VIGKSLLKKKYLLLFPTRILVFCMNINIINKKSKTEKQKENLIESI